MPRAIRDCGNPLLRDWMGEWMEEARNMQMKSYYTFKQAYESLSTCPMIFQHPCEAEQLKGIGAKLALRLEKQMIKYCQENGLPIPTRPKGKRRSAEGTVEDSSDSGNKRRRGAQRPYVPRLRTGPYAILLTLLDFKDNGQGSATKSEIIRNGQNYCDTSLDLAEPGSNYTAWSGIKILKDKSYVWQNGSPARFTLTETGESMAQHLRTATFNNENGIPSSSSQTRNRNTPAARFSQQAEPDDDSDGGPPAVDLSLYVSNPEEFRRERAAETTQTSLNSASSSSIPHVKTISTTRTPTSSTTANTARLSTPSTNISTNEKSTHTYESSDGECEPAIDLSLYVLDPDAYRQKNSGTPARQQQTSSTSTYRLPKKNESTPSQSDDVEVITLLSPSPSPSPSPIASPSIRPQTQNSSNDLFQYTYLDTMDNPACHLSQAAVEIDQAQGCLMYKIRYLSQQSGHSKTHILRNIDRDKCTAYLLENDADLVCPGLPTRTLLPLHTDQYEKEHDFWPEEPSSQQQSSAPASQSTYTSPPSLSSADKHLQHTTAPLNNESQSNSDNRSPMTPDITMDILTMASIAKEDGRIWQPHEYTVMMVLDNREVKMKTNREYIQDKLEEKGVSVVKRALDLGDVLWVAKHVETEEEMYLDIVVERKRMDDLVSSVKDGRFREQKYRLKESGSRKIFYVVEEYNKEAAVKFGAQAIQTALSSVQAIDRFYLKRTNSLDETIEYLVRLTKTIEQLYKDAKLQEIPTRLINRNNYLALKNELSSEGRSSPSPYHVIPYDIYNQLNSKSGTTTLQDLYTKMLMTIRGVNAEKAHALIRVYPTPHHLLRAMYEAITDGNAKQLATQATRNGITRRRWPASASERLWEVWGKRH